MKNYLLASGLLLLTAACGTKPEEQAATADKPAAAPAAAPAAEGKELDLTQYGAPIVLRVPEGATAGKDASGRRPEVRAPKFALEVITENIESEAQAQSLFKMARDSYARDKNAVLLVDEPMLTYVERNRDGRKSYMLFRAVPDVAAKKLYLLSEGGGLYADSTITKADHDKMMESSRSAHLAGK